MPRADALAPAGPLTRASAAPLGLRAGEIVRVRDAAEIRETLDAGGCLDGLPFMPEMLALCGQQHRVSKRADKTCDTIGNHESRRMRDAVHLEGIRCDGSAHGGCQAGCLIFWKEAWLERADAPVTRSSNGTRGRGGPGPGAPAGCTEETLLRATRAAADGEDQRFACQATELLRATSGLPWWDVRQYVREVQSRNVRVPDLVLVLARAAFNAFLRRARGVRYPMVRGKLQGKTPIEPLGLRPGDLVQVKTKAEIEATLDRRNRNRGLAFDVEMVPYCGRTFRVLRRVERIIDDRTGKMIQLPNDCLVLDGVTCGGCLSRDRLFCPRAIYPYWREVWLRRADLPR